MKQSINAIGWECPKPLIETKKLLDTMSEGTVVTTVDDKLSVPNLMNFAENLGYEVSCVENSGEYEISITKNKSEYDKNISATDNLVIQITTDTYGAISEGLGKNLMKMYMYALTEVTPQPKILFFINKGALLTADGSPVLDSLRTLEAKGVEILTCAACISFYGLDENPKVGSITNMYTIVEKMNNADNTIIV